MRAKKIKFQVLPLQYPKMPEKAEKSLDRWSNATINKSIDMSRAARWNIAKEGKKDPHTPKRKTALKDNLIPNKLHNYHKSYTFSSRF